MPINDNRAVFDGTPADLNCDPMGSFSDLVRA